MEIQHIIKEAIRNQKAYQIEDVPHRIKLDANENPYPLSPALREKLIEYFRRISLHRYPDPGCTDLKARFAEYYGVDEDMLLIGNGSDELILMLLIAFGSQPAGGVIIPTPTFAMYNISGVNTGHRIVEIPLNERFDVDMGPFLEAMTRTIPHLLFLSYPNNPTGNLYSREKIETILQKSEGIVVVDEAYVNFSKDTFLTEITTWDNLVVLRTLSKIGFAAMRLGIFIGHPKLVREVNKVRLPYNINAFSQAAAHLFLDHDAEFQDNIRRIIRSRDALFSEMKNIEGITPYRTDANFILFSCTSQKNNIYKSLLDNGILVKQFSSPDILTDCLRVTIGTDEENGEFLRVLKDSVIQ